MFTLESLFFVLIFLVGGVALSSVTVFLTLAILLLGWRTLAGVAQGLGLVTKKNEGMQALPIHHSRNHISSSSPTSG